MIEELAVVVKIDKHRVWVESGQNSACGACLQKASCTANAIGSVRKNKSVPVDCELPLQIGDKVMVAIDENLLLGASLLLYLLPLIALFSGAGIAEALAGNSPYADLSTAAGAILGFLLSLWLINKAQRRLSLRLRRPVVVKKL